MIFSFAVTHCVAVKCTLHSIHHPRPDMTSFFSFLAPLPLLLFSAQCSFKKVYIFSPNTSRAVKEF